MFCEDAKLLQCIAEPTTMIYCVSNGPTAKTFTPTKESRARLRRHWDSAMIEVSGIKVQEADNNRAWVEAWKPVTMVVLESMRLQYSTMLATVLERHFILFLWERVKYLNVIIVTMNYFTVIPFSPFCAADSANDL